ncbi:LOW QUALITY PROTEIN: glutamic acid-rich protein-like [Manduca sexta]|uniref:Uncharacterized protein n=1 Tax=Manduca sexta TaxID=7130 RepID=A0A921ZUD9_MANSE|nr:LOW QUALITY PROTEIN: glutamic acid-rich protein-like [Manduca sexta]KAG6463934.1 hypothetical protein O3G_MSEX014169 [Manduca sexta]
MSRMKKHKIKTEKPVASTSASQEKEHDLAYYIHDRVELMHQVFSVLKYKDLKAMAPECVRHISIDDLQELCTEELLGISSKRLCAVLDGAAPPSDTESSSRSPSPPLETISLDSISSDEEILSQSSTRKKHKHRRRRSKSKKKSKEPREEDAEKSKASRAGLTVLELLELQARARAIRAQLQQEQSAVEATAPTGTHRESHSSDNEVEIKEEQPDVVEISSEDEKPDVKELEKQTDSQQPRQVIQQSSTDGKTVTKRINDLIITVPQAKPSRKIKLNRTKVTPAPTPTAPVSDEKEQKATEEKRKKKKKDKKKKVDKEGSDHDEITLQLSDSEKMDVLGLEQKNFEAASTKDSDSSSDNSEEEDGKKDKSSDKDKRDRPETVTSKDTAEKDGGKAVIITEQNKQTVTVNEKDDSNAVTISEENIQDAVEAVAESEKESVERATEDSFAGENVEEANKDKPNEKVTEIEISHVEVIPLIEDSQNDKVKDSVQRSSTQEDISTVSTKTPVEREMSEGELSDRDSSEVEAFEPPPEVVCISDEETGKKKKKKKEKKAKKEKKSKKKDFRDGVDQNFYTSKEVVNEIKDTETPAAVIDSDGDNRVTDDACVILELSDDSSCYEVEGTVLSKEPTAEEIEALSAKIDEIEREEVVTDEQIRDHERMLKEKEKNEEIENVSWKDRYLDSRKVKRVLSTSNILNAIRKKNKELKKKLQESKVKERDDNDKAIVAEKLEEGSIEHYNTLQGSTKFVDPVKEAEDSEKSGEEKVTREIRKDAKQLLKMYKKLMKYNDMNRQRDPNKKKKKKKKSKSKNGEEATSG